MSMTSSAARSASSWPRTTWSPPRLRRPPSLAASSLAASVSSKVRPSCFSDCQDAPARLRLALA